MNHALRLAEMKHLFIYACACAMLLTGCTKPAATLTILHTNDTHSQVEPTDPHAAKNADRGGYARRMGLIAQERQADPNLLLLDAGDFSQGSPYFNFYRGRVEIEAMNRMGYDAGTLGNHEFDNGVDTLAMVVRLAKYPIVCANYDCTGTPLEGLIKPYVVLRKVGLKIGVMGIGVSPEDLIAPDKFGAIRYLDPLPVINETAALLREKEHCDVVIVLSHLGTDNINGCSDEVLAAGMKGVDIVIGGHTHHIISQRVADADGHEVLLAQAGKAGLQIGKIVLNLSE